MCGKRALTYKNAHTPSQGGSFDPSNEDTLPSNIMDLPHIMNNGDEKLVVQILSDDEETEAPEVLSSAVADDGKDSSAADVAPTEPETKLSEAAEAAGDDDGQPDDESFDVANYEALTAWVI